MTHRRKKQIEQNQKIKQAQGLGFSDRLVYGSFIERTIAIMVYNLIGSVLLYLIVLFIGILYAIFTGGF